MILLWLQSMQMPSSSLNENALHARPLRGVPEAARRCFPPGLGPLWGAEPTVAAQLPQTLWRAADNCEPSALQGTEILWGFKNPKEIPTCAT